jgi:rRNA maturation endonuclease Nob1
MDLLNSIGKKVATAAKAITRKSEDMVELTKLNLTIGNEEDKVKRLLYEIGSELYRGYINGSSNEGLYDKQCNEVKQLEDNLKILKERLLELKGNKTCIECKTVVALDVKYCPNCGEKLEKKEIEMKEA